LCPWVRKELVGQVCSGQACPSQRNILAEVRALETFVRSMKSPLLAHSTRENRHPIPIQSGGEDAPAIAGATAGGCDLFAGGFEALIDGFRFFRCDRYFLILLA
jgi:hypothetical protein